MATIRNNVTLRIAESQGNAFVEVSFAVDASAEDIQHQQAYRAVVELIGVDEGPGEDGRSEATPNGQKADQLGAFGVGQTVARNMPSALLDEDPGPFPRRDELRARVTLIPTTLSNVVTRGAFIVNQ